MSGHLSNGLWIRTAPSYYSPAQILGYLRKIGIHDITDVEVEERKFVPSLDQLTRIMRGHLLTFPWENTAMHYSKNHQMDVTPDGLYERLVGRGEGSYCFGQNIVLLGILRGLGFRVYSGAARVNTNNMFPEKIPEYTSLTHMVVFVQPIPDSNATYVVDVGFGSSNLARPIPLSVDGMVQGIYPGETHRLTRSPSPKSSVDSSSHPDDPVHIKWNLEVIHAGPDGIVQPDQPWRLLYSFTEEELQLRDYEDASFVISQKPGPSFFWQNVLAVKCFPDDVDITATTALHRDLNNSSEAPLYRLTLIGKELKQHRKGKRGVLKVVNSERERLEVLKQYFGIDIDSQDAINIQGRAPEIVDG